jgi:hypothetical protein
MNLRARCLIELFPQKLILLASFLAAAAIFNPSIKADDGVAPVIDPPGTGEPPTVVVTQHPTEKQNFKANGGSAPEPKEVAPSPPWAKDGAPTYNWTYDTLVGDPASGTEGGNTLVMNRDVAGKSTIKVRIRQNWKDKTGNTTVTKSPESTPVVFIVVKVDLKEVSFSGAKYHEVQRDNTETYEGYKAPHWQDNSKPLDGDADDNGDKKFPVSYTRKTTAIVSALFIINAKDIPNAKYKIKADGDGNLDFPEKEAKLEKDKLTVSDMVCKNPFTTTIDFLNPLEINWEISFDDGSTWSKCGKSKNRVYVTLEDPRTHKQLLFETLLDIGCRNAKGKDAPNPAVDAVWSDFTDRNVTRKPIDGFNKTDGVQMGYWLEATQSCNTYTLMIGRPSGNGTCSAWADLLGETIKALGIDGTKKAEITADKKVNKDADGALIKIWKFGNHIRTGPDGIRQTDLAGDDHQLIAKGNGAPNAIGVTPGPDKKLDSVPAGDDKIVGGKIIDTGADGICQTAKAGDDIQILSVGNGEPNQPCITPGANGALNSTKAGDDTEAEGRFPGTDYPYLLFHPTDPKRGTPSGDVADQLGVAAQKNDNPPGFFRNHFVIRFDNKIYDPSYGLGPYDKEIDHENAAIDGIKSGDRAKKHDEALQELHYTK